MGVAVAISPTGVVGVAHAARGDPLEEGSQVSDQPGLVLDSSDTGRGAGDEDVAMPLFTPDLVMALPTSPLCRARRPSPRVRTITFSVGHHLTSLIKTALPV